MMSAYAGAYADPDYQKCPMYAKRVPVHKNTLMSGKGHQSGSCFITSFWLSSSASTEVLTSKLRKKIN